MSKGCHNQEFPGFPAEGQYWQFPTIINGYVNLLNGNEFKVLWYILRHTYGYQKEKDRISIRQIMEGITKKDGTILDRGTGIRHKNTVHVAIRSLERMRFISRISGKVEGKPNTFQPTISGGGIKSISGVLQNLDHPGSTKVEPKIDNRTIKKRQYSSLKKKPYFRGEPMRWYREKWWVIPKDGGSWLEFAGEKKDIEWR